MKFAAHAGIEDAAIALADGPWTSLHEELSALAGSRLLDASVDVLAVDEDEVVPLSSAGD